MRRAATLFVALTLMVVPAACGSAAHRATGGGVASVGGSTTTVLPERDSRRTAPSTTRPSAATAGRSVRDGGSTATTAAASASTVPADPLPADDGSRGGPGAFARTLLGANGPGNIVLQELVQSGAGPRTGTIDHLERVLQAVTGKHIAAASTPLSGGAKDWTADDLVAAADAAPKPAGSAAVVDLLFVHGTFGGDDQVLGITVRGNVLAVFEDQVRSSETPVVSGGDIEDAVTMHEMGHVMGLVDLVLHTGRADPDHPYHSTDQNSVMYWAVESSLVTQVLHGGPPRDFDNQDLADLATIRAGS